MVNYSIDKFIEVILETRKGFNQKAFLYNSSGEDSPPIKNDKIVLLKIDGSGKYIAIGVLTESKGAKPGEKFIFSRDENGIISAITKMLNDGTIEIDSKKFVINGGGKKAARKDDEVEITIPANSFIVSVTGQAVGTLNPTPVIVKGKITEGSDTIELGD